MRGNICRNPVEMMLVAAVVILAVVILHQATMEEKGRAQRHAAAKADIRDTLRERRN